MTINNPQKKYNRSNKVVILASLAVLIILSFGSGYLLGLWEKTELPPQEAIKTIVNKSTDKEVTEQVDFNLFWKVWEIVQEKAYQQPVDQSEMFYGAVSGIAASLGDPYSVFLDPELSKSFNDEINGTFEGIGAEIGVKNNQLVIISPLSGTPAETSGLKSGDMILAIDGEDTSTMSLEYAVNLIRGEAGTDVVLTILRSEADSTEDINVTRDDISVPSVNWEMQGDLAYINIVHFNSDTAAKFNQAIQELLQNNPKGVILDLRNNPGGYLDQSIDVASQFIEEGVVVYEKFSDQSIKEYQATGQAQLSDYPVVVLINQGSASASEIVAGALQDYSVATLVGETTFGKGSVQDYQQFSDGSSLKLTVAKWLTPDKNNIDQQGISPDIEVEYTVEDYNQDKDPQLDKAIEILN